MGLLSSSSRSTQEIDNSKTTKTYNTDNSQVINNALDGGAIENAFGFSERTTKNSLSLIDKAVTAALNDGQRSRTTLSNLIDKEGAEKQQTVSLIMVLILVAGFVLSLRAFFGRKK